MKDRTPPLKVRIASPCRARWEDMEGDHRQRFCNQCRKNVYNLSAVSAAEAAALLEAKSGQICVRLYQRSDGTLLTQDCPVGETRKWRRVKLLVVGGVTAVVLAFANLRVFSREDDDTRHLSDRISLALDDMAGRIEAWLPARTKTGKIAMTPIRTQQPDALMGEPIVSSTNRPPKK